MDQKILQLFDTVPFKSSLTDFTPGDTTPWDRVDVDDFLAEEYQETCTNINAGATVDKIERAAGWIHENTHLPPGADILDIGCGPGLYSHRLAELGYRVTGIDINDRFLAFARTRAATRAAPCTYRKLPISDLDYSQEFDLVLATQGPSLQFTPTEMQICMRQVKHALRPGGHLLCEFSIEESEIPDHDPEITVSRSLPGRRLLGKPLSAQMLRRLSFPNVRTRVNHRIFLYQDGELIEFWSRFPVYTRRQLVDILERIGFQIRGFFGPVIGQPPIDGDQTCHVWAYSPARQAGAGE